MLRKVAFTIALTLLPAVASAQEHNHPATTTKTQHEHAAAAKTGEHMNFVQMVMAKRAELKLTDEQIAKLEDASAKMAKHHAAMEKSDVKPSEADRSKMHEELMSIFTEEQAVKVKEMMKQHMAGMCAMGEDKQCKMESKKKEQLQ
jgi:choline dehydrogenase-like flavoprotein